jgi:hypothetical protein
MGKRFDRNLPYVGMSEESRLLLDRLVREDDRELREMLRGAVAMIECAPCDAFKAEELTEWLAKATLACASCDWQTAILCNDAKASTCKARVDEARAIQRKGVK